MKLKTTLLATVAALSLTSAAMAATSVAIVDLNQVFQGVPQGAPAFATLKQQLAPQVTSLQTQQQTEKTQLLAEQNKLQQAIQAFQKYANDQEQLLLTSFGTSMKTAVGQVAKSDGDDLVLSNQSTLFNIQDTDITPQVIATMKTMPATPAPATSTAAPASTGA
jgi:Skp family chaperone for outer membrane proteins